MRRAMAARARARRSRRATPRSSSRQATSCSSSTSRTRSRSTSRTRSRIWDGDGAVLLTAYDAARRALLDRALRAGHDAARARRRRRPVTSSPGLLPRLWKPPLPQIPPCLRRSLHAGSTSCHGNGSDYGRPFERRLLDAAVAALRELGPTQGALVIGNEDLHAGNVLTSAARAVARDRPEAARRGA